MKKCLPAGMVLGSLLLASSGASASLLSGGFNIDNQYWAYISTANDVQGSLISSGNNWTHTYSFSDVNLSQGQNYFLHVYAEDVGGIASFLGEFNLAGTGHLFSNGSTNLVTNTTDWDVSTTGWGNYADATKWGDNGSSPWGYRSGVSGAADWIWSSDAHNHNQVYFSTMISSTAVPEPSSMMLLGLGIAGLLVARKKTK